MAANTVDVAVIGAGPAGLAAATQAARAGLSVVLLDEQEAVGGQIYRAIERSDAQRRTILGATMLPVRRWRASSPVPARVMCLTRRSGKSRASARCTISRTAR